MTLLFVFLLPAICLFVIFCLALLIDSYMRFCQWLSALTSFCFDVPINENKCNLNHYGLGGMLSQYGESKIRKLSKNYLTFEIIKNGENFDCFLASSDANNQPYKHPIIKLKRDVRFYPISIEAIGKDYFEIQNEHSLKSAIDEILESEEINSLIESMIYVFWSNNSNPELNSVPLDEVESREYKNLMKLRKNHCLKNNKDRCRLIEICQKLLPPFGQKIVINEMADLERISLVQVR